MVMPTSNGSTFGVSNVSTQTIAPITGNPKWDGLLDKGIIFIGAIATGWIIGYLKRNGWYDSDYEALISADVVTFVGSVAFIIYSFIKGSRIGQLLDKTQVDGVVAGINLVATGNAIAHATGSGEIVPAPVTTESAKVIVDNFGTQVGMPVLGKATDPNAVPEVVTAQLNVIANQH